MFTRIVVSALFAGVAAGLIAALLQLWLVQPVLLHAELYEGGDLIHYGAEAVPVHQDLGGIDPLRDGLSLVFTALIYTGYALVLIALMSLAEERGHRITAQSGMIWGLAGFVAVQMAPALGLAPELPGSAAADLTARQVWWFGTVAASGLGLALMFLSSGWAARGVGIVLLLVPHIIGAPQPESFHGPVPPELSAEFAARALGVGLAAWVLLGLLAGHFWQREGTSANATPAE